MCAMYLTADMADHKAEVYRHDVVREDVQQMSALVGQFWKAKSVKYKQTYERQMEAIRASVHTFGDVQTSDTISNAISKVRKLIQTKKTKRRGKKK